MEVIQKLYHKQIENVKTNNFNCFCLKVYIFYFYRRNVSYFPISYDLYELTNTMKCLYKKTYFLLLLQGGWNLKTTRLKLGRLQSHS